MSSFEPIRIPAWLAPVCDERSVSHSTKRWLPSASQRAMVGALPSRIARCRTGSASPSISRKTIPGAPVNVRPPVRLAIRWITLNVYVSSSFVPRTTSSATPTAEATKATPSADQNEFTERSPPVIGSAASRIRASTTRTRTSPTSSMNGSRRAAISGGRTAFRTAIATLAAKAPPKPLTVAPGTTQAATRSATADASHVIRRRSGRSFGRAGLQVADRP